LKSFQLQSTSSGNEGTSSSIQALGVRSLGLESKQFYNWFANQWCRLDVT